MIWTIIGILLVLWILGIVFHIAGAFVHFLLVIAAIVLLFKIFSGMRGNNSR
ncbi:lmo0937 family membrane protein [Heyndrickxia coagulans]|uniref:lmo0937 family membrane protein n=1 Tax=Heyndrickxia coagulans TaxID=1398 RepID=UPI001A942690|nr:lmo0937 family membrane protein [Heyndrickxia coagulans]